jgi:hypothetical protein
MPEVTLTLDDELFSKLQASAALVDKGESL